MDYNGAVCAYRGMSGGGQAKCNVYEWCGHSDVPESAAGVMKLLQNGCYRAVVDFTGRCEGLCVDQCVWLHSDVFTSLAFVAISATSAIWALSTRPRAFKCFCAVSPPWPILVCVLLHKASSQGHIYPSVGGYFSLTSHRW